MSEPGKVTQLPAPRAGVALQPGEFVTTESDMAEALKKAAEKGRADERRLRKAALEAQAEAHAGEIERLGVEKVEAQKDAHAHGFHKAAWMIGLPAFGVGATFAALLATWILMAGTESTVRGAAAGSMIRAQETLERDVRTWERGDNGALERQE